MTLTKQFVHSDFHCVFLYSRSWTKSSPSLVLPCCWLPVCIIISCYHTTCCGNPSTAQRPWSKPLRCLRWSTWGAVKRGTWGAPSVKALLLFFFAERPVSVGDVIPAGGTRLWILGVCQNIDTATYRDILSCGTLSICWRQISIFKGPMTWKSHFMRFSNINMSSPSLPMVLRLV